MESYKGCEIAGSGGFARILRFIMTDTLAFSKGSAPNSHRGLTLAGCQPGKSRIFPK